MSSGERVWYRSLYWRIALGFIGFLAVLLLAQSMLFVWLAGRTSGLRSKIPDPALPLSICR